MEAIDSFIKELVLYVKNAVLEVIDDETFEQSDSITIADTRSVESNEFWQNSSECLQIIVESYMNSGSWKTDIMTKAFQALTNIKHEENAIKN